MHPDFIYMFSFLAWLVVSFCGTIVIWLACRIYKHYAKITPSMIRDRTINRVCYVLCATVVLSPLYYEFPTSRTGLVRFEGDRVIPCRFGTWQWNAFSNLPEIPVTVRGATQILVVNNRVKRIVYAGFVEISSKEIYFSKLHRRKPNSYYMHGEYGPAVSGDMASTTAYWFNELNEQLTPELGKFYNGGDPDQQQKFRALVEPWPNERLGTYDGLKISGMSFSVE